MQRYVVAHAVLLVAGLCGYCTSGGCLPGGGDSDDSVCTAKPKEACSSENSESERTAAQ